jgi:hypothetical protein
MVMLQVDVVALDPDLWIHARDSGILPKGVR